MEQLEYLELINKLVQEQHKIREEAYKNKRLGFDLELKDFINIMRLLPPQNYGLRIQNRIIEKLKFTKINASENNGDCLDNFGDAYEIKVSIIDGINNDLNVVNIREWQSCHYYIIAFDCRNSELKTYFFRLSNNEMKNELNLLSTSNVTGTKESNTTNINIEKRFSIKIDSENFKRWINLYYSKASFLI